jgi:DNA-binding NarL/FixJ family response regulator
MLIDLQEDMCSAGRATQSAGVLELAAQGIDVILLDLSLDDGSTIPLLKQLCGGRPGTAIVVFTGHADERITRLCLEAGADRVVVKSSPVELLLAALREAACERRRSSRPDSPAIG